MNTRAANLWLPRLTSTRLASWRDQMVFQIAQQWHLTTKHPIITVSSFNSHSEKHYCFPRNILRQEIHPFKEKEDSLSQCKIGCQLATLSFLGFQGSRQEAIWISGFNVLLSVLLLNLLQILPTELSEVCSWIENSHTPIINFPQASLWHQTQSNSGLE